MDSVQRVQNMSTLQHESVVLPPDAEDGGYPLYVTAKRYFLDQVSKHAHDPDALTIITLHSTSFHKETWEPTLERLFELATQPRSDNPKIREVWAIDCPNHGCAGVLNREVLKQPEFASDFSCERYAVAVHRFLSAGPILVGVDFRKRNLVGLGHSLGANAMLLLQRKVPAFFFQTLIIVEPMLSPDGAHHLDNLRDFLVEGARKRVSEWKNRDAAYRSLKTNPRTARWDERVLRAFVTHAIAPMPCGTVGLACTREQEVAMYLDVEGPTEPVIELTRACMVRPVHLVLGSRNDFIPLKVHEALVAGRKYASEIKIPGVGHLIPQERPDQLGGIVYEILRTGSSRRSAKM